MLCQEESHPFQILFIPGIYCHLLDQELLSFPLLSSPLLSPRLLDEGDSSGTTCPRLLTV